MQKYVYLVLILLVCFVPRTYSEGVHELSEETRALLKAEMNEIAAGMHELFDAYYSGNLEKVSKIAKNIEQSYILKQKLTVEQKKELQSTLPAGFKKIDQQFHYNAGMLSHAADRQKVELVGFYYSEVSKGCLSCHSNYAQERFGHIKPNDGVPGGHHHH